MNELFANHSCYEDEEDNITAYIESNLGVYFYDQIGFLLSLCCPFSCRLFIVASLHKTNKKGFQMISWKGDKGISLHLKKK